MSVRLERVYEPSDPGDGERFLVERLWPRGLRRDALRLTAWLRDVAPSDALRRWFQHDPAKWPEFRARYREELARKPDAWAPLLAAARRGPVTLLFSARDPEQNSAVVLRDFLLEQLLGGSGSSQEDAASSSDL
ncbi:MAG: DUF488 family protein [Thermomicrobium sp.]|nr:DUF488 family protein [Thermomicrobium sp.]MDW8058732.1 DUF488 family protein [Thermomicrobium sp.]